MLFLLKLDVILVTILLKNRTLQKYHFHTNTYTKGVFSGEMMTLINKMLRADIKRIMIYESLIYYKNTQWTGKTRER